MKRPARYAAPLNTAAWRDSLAHLPYTTTEGHFFWPADDKCYEEFTRGPCDKSKLFVSVLRNSVCTCNDQWGFTVLNPEDGTCYLRNTQGPCQPGEMSAHQHWISKASNYIPKLLLNY